MVFKDCNNDIELRNHSRFMDAYRQAREEERLPELAEDRAVFDFCMPWQILLSVCINS